MRKVSDSRIMELIDYAKEAVEKQPEDSTIDMLAALQELVAFREAKRILNFEKTRMTFEEMVEIEPLLGSLKFEAEIHNHIPSIERERLWYRDLKKRMSKMVGFEAKDERLSSCECYDTAYQTLIKALKV